MIYRSANGSAMSTWSAATQSMTARASGGRGQHICLIFFWPKRTFGIRQIARSNSAAKWVTFVRRAFEEENLRYRGDEQGGVHYKPDGEFARNPASALSSLQSSRYNAVREAFETARSSLDSREPENAIRSVFIAAAIASRRSLLGVSIAGLARHGVNLVHRPSSLGEYLGGAMSRSQHLGGAGPGQGQRVSFSGCHRASSRSWVVRSSGDGRKEGRRSAAWGANAPGREEAEFELLDD